MDAIASVAVSRSFGCEALRTGSFHSERLRWDCDARLRSRVKLTPVLLLARTSRRIQRATVSFHRAANQFAESCLGFVPLETAARISTC